MTFASLSMLLRSALSLHHGDFPAARSTSSLPIYRCDSANVAGYLKTYFFQSFACGFFFQEF
jgi:hypothetical protein